MVGIGLGSGFGSGFGSGLGFGFRVRVRISVRIRVWISVKISVWIRVVEQSGYPDSRSQIFFIFHASIPCGGATILKFWIRVFLKYL